MKKLILLCCAMQCIFLTACWRSDKNISIRYKDNHDSYTMDAWFGKSKTSTAERYMNYMIGRENNISFHHTHTDAVLTLEDGSKFYMKKSPGHILIKMNRDETSEQAYHKMKDMCRGIKDVVLE